MLEDQPIRGLNKAVWWIEYVLRHQGAPHLKSPSASMSFVDYFMVDVIIFLTLAILIMNYLLLKSVVLVFRIFRKVASKVKRE